MQNHSEFGTPYFSTPHSNIDLFVNEIATKVPKCIKYGIKIVKSSDFWFVSNVLSFPSIICVDKRDWDYKGSSDTYLQQNCY